MGCCALRQEIFPTQELNQSLVSPAQAERFFTTSTIWEAPVIRVDLNIFVLLFFIDFQLLLKNIIFLCRNYKSVQFSCSVVSNSTTPWTAARQASLSITNNRSLLKLTSIKSVIPSIQPSHPMSSPCPALNLSQHQGLFQ